MAVWNLLGAGVIGLWVGGMLVLSRLPDTRLSHPLRAFASAGALWAVGDLVAANAPDFFWKQVGVAMLYSGAIFVPPLWWLIALRGARELGLASALEGRRWTAGPLLFATIMWLVMITNPWHGRFIVPVLGGQNQYGPLWWVLAVPNWALVFGVFALEAHVSRRVRDVHVHRQAALVVFAGGLMLVANWLYVSGLAGGLNSTLPVMGASGAILVVGMLREGLFGVLPAALPVMAFHDPDGLLVVRPNGRLLHANPRARAMLEPVVLAVGLPFLETLAQRLRGADGQAVAESGSGWEARWWRSVLQPGGALYRYGRGEGRWLRVSAQPVYGRGQKLLAHCLRVHDATEEQRTETALRRARRLESVAEVALGVAHDFKNLLVVARGNAELLADKLPDTPGVQRKLHRILRSADEADELARQLQVYAGADEPCRTRLDLVDLAKQALELFDPELASELAGGHLGVRLALELSPAAVEADATQLRQLALNLLLNARDALDEEGGEIRMETGCEHVDPAQLAHLVVGEDRPAGAYGYLRVADTGEGMEPEVQERIFEPFFSTKGKQRGIGLATVFGVVRSHGALLQLESRRGEGTAFTVWFPAAAG
jgi:signal transduction histidine kinase